MALAPERIMELEQQSYVKGHRQVSTKDCWGDKKITYEPTEHFNMFMFARTIEAEVRKSDEALIQQLVEALESVDDAMPFPVARQVLKVARARLEGKP